MKTLLTPVKLALLSALTLTLPTPVMVQAQVPGIENWDYIGTGNDGTIDYGQVLSRQGNQVSLAVRFLNEPNDDDKV